MKIIAADVILGILGVFLVAGAGVPFADEISKLNQTSTAGLFDVTFQLSQKTLPGSTSFTVRDANVTKAIVTINCSDAYSATGAYTLHITVTGNKTKHGPTDRPCAPGTIEVPVDSVPTLTQVAGSTDQEARANLAKNTSTKAQGAWEIKVTGTRAGATGGLVPVPPPTPSFAFAVEIWNAEVKAINPTIPK